MAGAVHPWDGRQRDYRAVAMPTGDRRNGVTEPLVALFENYGTGIREKLFSVAEAEQIHREMGAALRAFRLGDEMSPRPAQGSYPFTGHRTMADIGGEVV